MSGMCGCGCGQETAIATRNYSDRGDAKGQSKKFLPGHRLRHPEPLFRRFWSKVVFGKCWIWTAYKDKAGYGRIGLGGRGEPTVLAPRAAWFLVYGVWPAARCVLHTCDTPACVRPSHLFLGTPKDNTHDMIRKGRHRGWFVKLTEAKP